MKEKRLSSKDFHVELHKINSDLFCLDVYKEKYPTKGTDEYRQFLKKRDYWRDAKRFIVHTLRERNNYKPKFVDPMNIRGVKY